ncbi:MAG: DUF6062 family protein [Ruminococcus sp.]|uniref:DUF6062 family protein n=1 Tax=Ruminococcus sp. TaxID=41978 RepID=UPI0025DD255A|nr:DUF6062 family protein [Ruminococcus sp.]MCR5542234.1 DUF6062 family protein [Ruminococcus sp.]
MRESILTIPVTEIFEPKCGCPICRLRDTLEQRTIEYIMGAAMMEPDVRIETNKQGFCKTHFEQMRACKNRLSLALMLSTHLQSLQKNVLKRQSIFEGKTAKQKRVSAVNNDCFVCNKIEWGMSRIMVTLFELYEQQSEFRQLFAEQEMLCLPHYDMLVSACEDKMSKKIQGSFKEACAELTEKYLAELEKDVTHYCNMYDYRNNGSDADWGNSKDSIERAIKFLTTR